MSGFPRLTLAHLKPSLGSNRMRTIVGRGPGSGLGKTSGKGHKGQNARENGPKLGFEGGQTQFYKVIPKMGMGRTARRLSTVNLWQIASLISKGLLDPAKPITMKTLHDLRVVSKIENGVKLLGTGKELLKTPISIEVSQASESAIKTIEASGGRITTVFYNQRGLRGLLHPHKFDTVPASGSPLRAKQIEYYRDSNHRGFLSPKAIKSESGLASSGKPAVKSVAKSTQ